MPEFSPGSCNNTILCFYEIFIGRHETMKAHFMLSLINVVTTFEKHSHVYQLILMGQATGKHSLCNMLLIKARTSFTYGEVNHPAGIYEEEHILTLNLLNLTSITFRSWFPMTQLVQLNHNSVNLPTLYLVPNNFHSQISLAFHTPFILFYKEHCF